MRYQVLGPLEAGSERTIVGLGGRKQRLVLALLLIDVGRTVAHDRLVDELWADEPPDGARHVIQTYVSELRRLVDDEIRWEGGGYRLAAPPDAVDARRFESLVESARDRMRDSPAGAGSLFREALALWRGEPYAGLEETPAVRLEAVRLRELRIGAIEDRLQADLDAGLHGPAAIELEALTREHPFRERLRSLQMVALYRAGRQADALAAYRQTREMLVEELGIDPSPELQSLEQRILAQDAALLPPALAGSIGTASAGEPSVVKATPYDVVRGFELRDHVGAGRTTTVYRGYQSSVGREVAIKVVHPQIADSAAFVQAFEPRAQAIARIDHRHVVPLLDFWRDDRGSFLVMPWMRSSLHEALRHGPWSLTATLRLLEQVGSALGAASEAGLNHGAVSTTNILLDGKGDALLTDFPIIPLRLETAAAGPSSDVRALAAVALEALTGRTDGTGREAGLRSFRPDIPAAVDALVRATLPGARAAPPGGVQDLLRGLRRAAGADVIAPPGGHVTASIRNPYKGLRAFQESDALDFFGRQVLAERLLDSVRERRFVALIGPSGSGKSSLVRAALIPAIRAGAIPGSQEWLVTEMFPAAHPFEELGSALLRVATRAREHILAELLADPGGMAHVARRSLPEGAQLILVVDQLEELFSLTTDAHVRSQFLDGLTQLATYADSPVRVVVTLRADFLDGPLQHRSFAELLRAGLVLITPPSAHDLSLAVARPAGQVGVDFESGLVERVVSDVAEQPGALPLLQHALTELFDRRDGRRLTTASYEAAGGVRGALGRRAEEVYASLPTPAREAARQVFLRLVSVDEQREDARRRVRRTELRSIDLQPGLIDVVLQEFGAHRLLSFDRDPVSRGPTVEVAHEALFREWPRLGAWIGDRRHDLRLQRRLQVAAADWRDAGTIDDYLLGGGRLEEFERWTAATDLALTQDERAYLVASRARERRLAAVRRRRRRFLFGGVLAAAFVGLALVTVAFTQQNRAQAEERLQRTRELAAASRDLITSDPDLAVLLALEAVEVRRAANESPVPEAVEALHEALLAHRLIQTADVGGFALAFVGDGERLFSSAPPRNRPTLWNLDTGEPIWTLPEVPEPLTGVAVSAAAEVAAQTYIGGPTRVWDLQSGQMIAELASLGDGSFLPALTTDGRLLAIVNVVDDAPQSVSIHDILAGDEQIRFDLPGDPTSVAFSPDGSRLAIGDGVAPVTRLFDVATGDVITSLGDAGDDRIVTSVAFHPSGKELAMFVSRPSEIQVIAVESGELTRTLTVGADAGRLCISGDGRILAAAAADELLHVWDFESGVETLTLPGTAQTNGLSCAPDATRLGSTTSSGAARIWDLTAQGSAEVLSIGTSRPFAASWSPDGQALLTSHHDAPLRRYAAEDGRLLAEAAGGEVIPTQFAVSPDGRHLAANGPFLNADAPDATPGMRPLLLYDAVTFEPIVEFEHGGVPIDLSDDGSLFLAGDVGVARVFDVTTGRTVQE
ncbi:MAG: BTAD domain-containing putative transcriptional regulator, partial [Candidatus Limnocylindria bacterium]